LSIPWGQLIAFLIVSALVGVLAALWPARRASRLNVLDAISSE
jgi:putative ABC transport system permease protein